MFAPSFLLIERKILIYLHDTVFFVTFAATKKIIMKKLLYLLIALSIYGCAEEKKEKPKLKFSEVYYRHTDRFLEFVIDKDYFYKEVYLRPGQKIKSKRKKMETRNNEVIVSSYASEIGKSEESVKVDKNTSEDISISFSSKYMLEALRTFEEEELLIFLNSDSKPIVLKSVKDESLIQLILPIKTY